MFFFMHFSGYSYPLSIDGKIGEYTFEELVNAILSDEINAKEYVAQTFTVIDSLMIASWTKIFDVLEDGESTLWHCSSGSGRTGLTTALVLRSLCVSEADIIEDYTKTDDYLQDYIAAKVAVLDQYYGEGAGEKIRPALAAEKEYIESFLNSIKNKYGSLDAFLVVLDVDVEKMRSSYLYNY